MTTRMNNSYESHGPAESGHDLTLEGSASHIRKTPGDHSRVLPVGMAPHLLF
jgi:hypothetical protein